MNMQQISDKISSIFGTCARVDKKEPQSEALRDMTNAKLITPQNLASNHPKCARHQKPIQSFCKNCIEPICAGCIPAHKSSFHKIFELKDVSTHVNTEVQTLSDAIKSFLDTFGEFELPDYSKERDEGLQVIEEAKTQLNTVIDFFFDRMKENFSSLYKKIPSREKLEDIYENLNQMLEEFKTYNKITSNFSTMAVSTNDLNEIKRYFESEYDIRFHDIINDYELLKEYESLNKRVNIPQVNINPSELEKIEFLLVDYVNTVASTEIVYNQIRKIRVNAPDYFLPEFESYLPSIDELNEKLNLYNISKDTQERINLCCDKEIPSDNSLIITPNLEIYFCGGILKSGELTSQTYSCSPFMSPLEEDDMQQGLSVEERAPMNSPKVAHSLCFIKNQIYCIGGRTGESTRTNACERYDIIKNKWEPMAGMNFERSRAAIASLNDDHIYVFYGTNSDGNAKTVERYSISEDIWTVLSPLNPVPAYEVTFASSVQINPNQILVLGGFYESQQNKSQIIFSKRAMLYNVNEDCFVNLGDVLGVPYCQSYPPIIANKSVYALGFIWRTTVPSFTRYMEGDYVFKIEGGNIQCKDILNYK